MPKRSSHSVVIKSCDPDSIATAVKGYVDKLREERPEIRRVIWFGSWVNGIPTPGSDVDLCLIPSSSDKSMRDRVPDYLPVRFPVGIDLFPYTDEEFRQLRTRSPSWYATISAGKER